MAFCVKRMRLGALIASMAWTVAAAEPPIALIPKEPIHVQRIEIAGGADLLTYFRSVSDPMLPGSGEKEIPFVSILRDTMGDTDPENDQLREVWAFTYTRPSLFKRVAAAVPFLYRHTGQSKPSGAPPALIDMASPGKGTWPRLIGNVIQTNVLDPLGFRFRATTRAYRSRAGEYRAMNLWRTLDLLSSKAPDDAGLTPAELQSIQGRLLLSRSLLGGLVNERYVTPAWRRFESISAEGRSHNWELLRQRAEDNHLYFQPLATSATAPSFALLWFDQSTAGKQVRFDSKFLGISDPFKDQRLQRWKDYSETWRLDAEGARTDEYATSARAALMIPLGLYGLEHPRAPLLLVDFRDSGKPRRRELLRRAADEVTTGVLGWTGFANWPYLAAKTTWSFVHVRHGAALDRDARVHAYVQLRQVLLSEQNLDPELRRELADRLGKLGVNPFDNAVTTDQEIAQRQYAALILKAGSPEFTRQLVARRSREAEPLMYSNTVRGLHRLGAWLTFGMYRRYPNNTPEVMALVDRRRRIQWHQKYLEDVLSNGSKPEVVADMNRVRRSVGELASLTADLPEARDRSSRLISTILARSGDEATRADCIRGLSRLMDRHLAFVDATQKTIVDGQ